MPLGTRMLLNILCEYLDKIRKMNVTANWMLVFIYFIFQSKFEHTGFFFPETSEQFKKIIKKNMCNRQARPA